MDKVFKGIDTDGKGTMGCCHGFKLHLACNARGEIVAYVLTGVNVSGKELKVFKVLAKRLYGKLFADKGYISQRLFDFLFEDGIQLVTGLRVNMKNKLMPFYDRMMLRKRYIIETILYIQPVSDGMGREFTYLSSHATNRYFILNWGKGLFNKGKSVFKKDKGGSDSKSDKTSSDKSNKTTKKKPVDDGSQPEK